MKIFFFITILFSTHLGYTSVLARSGQSDNAQYEAFLLTHPQYQSYLNWFRSNEPDIKTIELDGTKETLIREINKIESKPLRKSSIEVLISLYKRLVKDDPASDNKIVKQRIQSLIQLYPEFSNDQQEPRRFINEDDLKVLKKRVIYDFVDKIKNQNNLPDLTLFIDGIEYTQVEQKVLIDGLHQWVWISNATLPTLHQADFESLQKKVFIFEYHSNPSISEFDIYIKDDSIQTSLPNRLPELKIPGPSSKSSWLIPVGIIAGLVILNEFKDKKLVINLPF